jgi:hypothetical protein
MSRRQVKPGTALVNGCLELLAAEHVPAIRMNTGTFVFTDDKGKRRRFAAGEPGMADIMAFIPPENIRVVPPRPTVVPTSDMVRDQLPDIGTHGFTIERAMKRRRKAVPPRHFGSSASSVLAGSRQHKKSFSSASPRGGTRTCWSPIATNWPRGCVSGKSKLTLKPTEVA